MKAYSVYLFLILNRQDIFKSEMEGAVCPSICHLFAIIDTEAIITI